MVAVSHFRPAERVTGLQNIARERDHLLPKVYYHTHPIDGFTPPFIIPYVGLHGAITRQRDDGRLGSLRVTNIDKRPVGAAKRRLSFWSRKTATTKVACISTGYRLRQRPN